MTTGAFLQNYFVLNISMAAAWVIFISLKVALRLLKVQTKSLHMQRCAQILLVVSFATPMTLLVAPRTTFPAIEFHSWIPAKEATRGLHAKRSSKEKPRRSAVQTAPSNSSGTYFFFLFKRSVTKVYRALGPSLLGGLLVLGIFFYIYQFIMRLRHLKSVLESGTVLRKVRSVSIVVSDQVLIPFSVLLFRRAWVVVPVNILSSNQDLKIALKHELQHHRHGDTRWACYVEILACFFYLNPAFFLLKRNVTEFQELACDEVLVTRKKISRYEYGDCLVRVAAIALEEHVAPSFFAATTFAVSTEEPSYLKSFLGKRIEALASLDVKRRISFISILIMSLGVVLTALFAYGAQFNFVSSIVSAVNPGKVITDPAIQEISEKILAKAIASEGAKSGFVIVAEPSTGRVLAVANIDTISHKTAHWALSQMIEPASIAKTLVIAEALNKNLTFAQESHQCENGNYRYGDQTYHDWKKEGWNSLTTEETITNSSDICTIKIGEKLGASGLREMLEDFGFGPNGSVNSFAEAKSGQLPPRDDIAHPRLLPYVSAGYGFRVTPLEIVQAYGAIANGGNLMIPKPANELGGQVIRRVLSTEAATETKKILEQVVIKGTAKIHARSDFYTTAGKTATSFSADLTKLDWFGGDHKANFAAFIGFAPVSKPLIEVFVAIRDPKSRDGSHGATHAAPVFKEVIEAVLKHLGVAYDKVAVN